MTRLLCIASQPDTHFQRLCIPGRLAKTCQGTGFGTVPNHIWSLNSTDPQACTADAGRGIGTARLTHRGGSGRGATLPTITGITARAQVACLDALVQMKLVAEHVSQQCQ